MKTTNETMQELKQRGFLDKLDSTIRTMREAGSPEGPPTPFEFFKQVIGKLALAPQDVRDIVDTGVGAVKAVPNLVSRISRGDISAPNIDIKGILKHIAENPPAISTVAAALAPGAALKAYRETVPLHARTYLHHVLGVPGKFTHVTAKEKIALRESAQKAIDGVLETSVVKMKQKGILAREKLRLREMSDDGILKEHNDMLYTNEIENIIALSKSKIATKDGLYDFILKGAGGKKLFFSDRIPFLPEDVKRIYAARVRRRLAKVQKSDASYYREHDIGTYKQKAVIEGKEVAASDYAKIAGERPKGFYGNPPVSSKFRMGVTGSDKIDIARALGKHFIEAVKVNEKIVPKAIHDVYKFYPELYNFDKGHIRKVVKEALDNLSKTVFSRKYDIHNMPRITFGKHILRELREDISGEFLRKLAFGKRPTIVDINLMGGNKLNAVDKAALLFGSHTGSKSKR